MIRRSECSVVTSVPTSRVFRRKECSVVTYALFEPRIRNNELCTRRVTRLPYCVRLGLQYSASPSSGPQSPRRNSRYEALLTTQALLSGVYCTRLVWGQAGIRSLLALRARRTGHPRIIQIKSLQYI